MLADLLALATRTERNQSRLNFHVHVFAINISTAEPLTKFKLYTSKGLFGSVAHYQCSYSCISQQIESHSTSMLITKAGS